MRVPVVDQAPLRRRRDRLRPRGLASRALCQGLPSVLWRISARDVPAKKRSRRSIEEEENEEREQNHAHVRDRKDPPAATVDPIPLFNLTMTVAETDDEIDACSRAHEKEAEADDGIDEGNVGDMRHDVADHRLISHRGEETDEGDAHAVREGGAVHPEDTPRKTDDDQERDKDEAEHEKRLPVHLDGHDQGRSLLILSEIGSVEV